MSAKLHHGGRLDEAMARYGGTRKTWLDLSTGINPHSWPQPKSLPKLADSVWQNLPDEQALAELLLAARSFYQVKDEAGIIAANGTQALIEILPIVLQKVTSIKNVTIKKIAIVAPTYSEHCLSWQKAGFKPRLIEEPAQLSDDESLVIVNPNNPDGRVFAPSELQKIAKRLLASNNFLIIDQAFCDCYPDQSLIPYLPENALVLTSFGKFFGLAGLRLGFAIGSEAIMAAIRDMLGPWSVSGPALAIGKAALADRKWIEKNIGRLHKNSHALAKMLDAAGLEIIGINALFVYAKFEQSQALYEALAAQHILVRHFPDRPGFLRFGIPKNNQTRKQLQHSLEKVLGRA